MLPLVSLAALVGARIRSAEACSLFTPREFSTNPAHADDMTAPTLSGVTYVVARFDGGCEGTGAITVNFVAGDDRTPVAELGYELSIVSGGDDLFGMFGDTRQYWWAPNEVIAHFHDLGQALDVELQVVAVDLNGNRSAPARVHVQADAVEEPEEPDSGGCATAPGASALVVLAALLAIRRRGGSGRRGVLPRRA